jgi:hypothetical protein
VSDQRIEDDTTRATARLPGLDIEIIHRRSLNDEVEQLSINLQAMPSFEAFGRYLETANPFALCAQAVQLACLPWLNVARSVSLPSSITSTPSKLSSNRDRLGNQLNPISDPAARLAFVQRRIFDTRLMPVAQGYCQREISQRIVHVGIGSE